MNLRDAMPSSPADSTQIRADFLQVARWQDHPSAGEEICGEIRVRSALNLHQGFRLIMALGNRNEIAHTAFSGNRPRHEGARRGSGEWLRGLQQPASRAATRCAAAMMRRLTDTHAIDDVRRRVGSQPSRQRLAHQQIIRSGRWLRRAASRYEMCRRRTLTTRSLAGIKLACEHAKSDEQLRDEL